MIWKVWVSFRGSAGRADWLSHAEQSKIRSGSKLDVDALRESIAPRDVVLVMSAAIDQKANKIVLLRLFAQGPGKSGRAKYVLSTLPTEMSEIMFRNMGPLVIFSGYGVERLQDGFVA